MIEKPFFRVSTAFVEAMLSPGFQLKRSVGVSFTRSDNRKKL
jgi:hypothetical protein